MKNRSSPATIKKAGPPQGVTSAILFKCGFFSANNVSKQFTGGGGGVSGTFLWWCDTLSLSLRMQQQQQHLREAEAKSEFFFLHLLLARCFSSLFFVSVFSPLTLGRKWRGRWRIWWRTWCLPNPFQFDICVFPLLFFANSLGVLPSNCRVCHCRFPTALFPSAPFPYFPAPFPRRRSGDFRSCLGIPFLRNSRPFLLGKGAQAQGEGPPSSSFPYYALFRANSHANQPRKEKGFIP